LGKSRKLKKGRRLAMREEDLEKGAEDDFGEMITQKWVTKNKAAKILGYHERSIRNFVNEGKLIGYRDHRGYHIETLSLAKFLYKKMANLPSKIRSEAVQELFKTHDLIPK
jgi:hypothetical protein